MVEVMRIDEITRGRSQVVMHFSADDLRFSTAYWYSDLDLYDLEARFGAAVMEKIYFHQAAFEANKLASLRPSRFDLGPYRHLHNERFERLWRTIFRNVWAQWRYEHDDPHYEGPSIDGDDGPTIEPVRVEPGEVEVLSFCGGGKDSLVSARLLEGAGARFASYAYAHSIYGQAEHQHRLIDALLDHLEPVRRHRQWAFDDFLGSPVLEQHPEYGVKSVTAAETPASIFGVLPVLLTHGYRFVALGHEASCNTGNLIWDVTGEDVNHQWGKSLEAEALLNEYVQTELVENAGCFGVLQPIHDPVIFHLLNEDLDALPATHSCNREKPWCMRCPKCAYVWLGYQAYLPRERVDPIFGNANLFDIPENQLAYRQMLGLESHTPFECIGMIPEVRLAFELCRRKGHRGAAIETYAREVKGVDVPEVLAAHFGVGDDTHLPAALAGPLLARMRDAAAGARRAVESLIGA